MNINVFMEQGIKNLLKTVTRFYLGSRHGRSFLTKLVPNMRRSAKLRSKNEELGLHVPPFLIASIASNCNLHCAGCYARAGGACENISSTKDLSDDQWGKIFKEASELGVSFILLAGGEPLMRRGVLDIAAECKELVFPVFTNGTLLNADYIEFFRKHANLIPVLSIEGDRKETDVRRGAGTYDKINIAMGQLQELGILYGTSITVTNKNLQTVTDINFISKLRTKGCGITFFIEYVPTESGTENLVLSEQDILVLNENISNLKKQFKDMMVISFPGDEQAMGGCLAAGRGFFHINAAGGAEPCPFSPQSVQNLRDHSMIEVLQSKYFGDIRSIAANAEEHHGGCTLFEYRVEVEKIC